VTQNRYEKSWGTHLGSFVIIGLLPFHSRILLVDQTLIQLFEERYRLARARSGDSWLGIQVPTVPL
jgi:hypothetical protein